MISIENKMLFLTNDYSIPTNGRRLEVATYLQMEEVLKYIKGFNALLIHGRTLEKAISTTSASQGYDS